MDHIFERLQHLDLKRFCSSLLLDQLTGKMQANGCSAMIDSIILISKHFGTNFSDWPRGPKTPDKFGSEPLEGLWKAHQTPSTLAEYAINIENEVSQNWMGKKLKRFVDDHEGKDFKKEHAEKIAHTVVVEGMRSRGKRNSLTSGDWLIFVEMDLDLVFLCCAQHEEDDEKIFERVLRASTDFPLLHENLKQKTKLSSQLRTDKRHV